MFSLILNFKKVHFAAFLAVFTAIPQLMAQFDASSFSSDPKEIIALNDGYSNVNFFFSEDGNTLWYTKAGHPENVGGHFDQDVWKAKFINGQWVVQDKKNVNINSESNELVIGTGYNGLVYIMRYSKGEANALTTLHAYRESGDTLVKDHFIAIPPMEMLSEYFGFFIPKDESYILVSMKGQFSFGKEDLYVMLRKGEQWTEPIHLGAAINSSSFEMSPYMTADAQYLFFASGGHSSYGGPDIYVSKRLDNSWRNWSKPINLGNKVNSTSFEAYFSLDEKLKQAMFVSSKQGKDQMVYRMPYKLLDKEPEDLISPHRSASGFVRMEKLPSMRIKLNLMDENDQVIQSVLTSEEGYFNLQSFMPDRNYKIAIDDSIKTDLAKADIFLTNSTSEKMVFLNEKELGIFGFKVLSSDKVEDVESLENLASKGNIVDKPTEISGRVTSYGTLQDKLKIKILDDKNNVVQTIETDKEGFFKFNTQSKEKNYFLSVDGNNAGLVDVYEIFLTNTEGDEDIVVSKTGQQLFGFRLLNNGESLGMAKLPEVDSEIPTSILDAYGLTANNNDGQLVGYLQLNKLPMINAEISLINEHDVVLGTVKTDGQGKFEFENVIEVGDYVLKLSSQQEKELSSSEIFLAKNPTDVVYFINDAKDGVFAFRKLASEDPLTLYSLKEQTEQGKVVSEPTSIKGKFEYSTLPKQGVKLKLMDEKENIIQITEVKENGEFTFENYTVNKNYFIAVENGEGLSDIYEIYIGGDKKNVLVNRTNKSVYSFKVLPSQAVVLTQNFEEEKSNLEVSLSPIQKAQNQLEGLITETYLGDKQAYFEFDIEVLQKTDYVSLKRVVNRVNEGFGVIIRLSKENVDQSGRVDLMPLELTEAEAVIKSLVKFGVNESLIKKQANGSDQILIRIN